MTNDELDALLARTKAYGCDIRATHESLMLVGDLAHALRELMGSRDAMDSLIHALHTEQDRSERFFDRAHKAEDECDALRYVIQQAAGAMHGEGVEDQGEAWDKCLRILDAARDAVKDKP